MLTASDVERQRALFPAFQRTLHAQPVVYFDGPAGSQVPQSVADSVSHYLLHTNANHGGAFATSRESDALLNEAHQAGADFLGASDPEQIVFGANMTTLTFALSRALSRTWRPGDEILVTRLDHDANVSPWVLAAQDAGATIRHIDLREDDCTLDLKDFQQQLSTRTKLLAVGCASNAVGTLNPVRRLIAEVHNVGGLVFLDAVHFAPHLLPDVKTWDCDFLVCSAYKFFGPHVGMLYGKRQWLADLPAYKVRPAPQDSPGRWMTGTQNHEGIAGVLAAIDYLADLGRAVQGPSDRGPALGRRAALEAAYQAISAYEQQLGSFMIQELLKIPGIKVYGITDPARADERVPTVSFTHARHTAQSVAEFLGERGIFVWQGNFYALPLTERLGLEPHGLVRVGLLHYNTRAEVERLLAALRELP